MARLVGLSAPASITMPELARMPQKPERRKRQLERCSEKLPYALSGATAQKQILNRAEQFADELLKEVTSEPNNHKAQD